MRQYLARIMYTAQSGGRISLPQQLIKEGGVVSGDSFRVFYDTELEEIIFQKIGSSSLVNTTTKLICEMLSDNLKRSVALIEQDQIAYITHNRHAEMVNFPISSELSALISACRAWVYSQKKTYVFTRTIPFLTLIDSLDLEAHEDALKNTMKIMCVKPLLVKDTPVGALCVLNHKDVVDPEKAQLTPEEMLQIEWAYDLLQRIITVSYGSFEKR